MILNYKHSQTSVCYLHHVLVIIYCFLPFVLHFDFFFFVLTTCVVVSHLYFLFYFVVLLLCVLSHVTLPAFFVLFSPPIVTSCPQTDLISLTCVLLPSWCI